MTKRRKVRRSKPKSPRVSLNLSKQWVKPSQYKKVREDFIEKQDNKCAILKETLTNPVLDHSHKGCDNEGRIRGVLESIVNLAEGHINKIWKKHLEKNTQLTLPEFLRNLADYLESDVSGNPFHYGVLLEHKKWISRWRNETLIKRIVEMDKTMRVEELNEMNKQELTKIYLELIAKQLESE